MTEDQAVEGATPETQADASAAAAPAEAPKVETTTEPAQESGSWMDALPDELKGYVERKGFKSPGAVVESYRNSEKLHGVSPDRILKLPEDPSKEGAMDEVYARLGRPESPEQYTSVLGEDFTDDTYKEIAAKAHSVGVTDAQWQTLQKAFAEKAGATGQQMVEQRNQEFEDWKSENPQALQSTKQLVAKAGLTADEIDGFFANAGVEGLNVLAKISSLGFEKSIPQGDGGEGFAISANAAKAKIAEKLADEEFQKRYYHPNQRIRQSAIDEMERLHKAAAGG